jgi:uncharacterized protein YcnI
VRKIVQRLVLLAAFCVLAQAAFAHKDVEPKNNAEAANWIEEALRTFSNVKVTDVYVLYRSGSNDYSILLARTSGVSFG